MYFPYLRGKQFELHALLELSDETDVEHLDNFTNTITPIIEPVRKNSSLLFRVIDLYTQRRIKLILIVNPQVGEMANNYAFVKEQIVNKIQLEYPSNELIYGILINSSDTPEYLMPILNDFSDMNLCLIHNKNNDYAVEISDEIRNNERIKYNIMLNTTGYGYRRKFSNTVLLRDGFNKAITNAEYPDNEFFSDSHLVYTDLGYIGFGDFTITGQDFSETGGPAFTVAIHLTYEHASEDIWIRHFKSDRTETQADPGGKFLEALNHLYEFYQNHNNILFESNGLLELLELHRMQHFPGLGYLKKLSIKHHISLTRNLL